MKHLYQSSNQFNSGKLLNILSIDRNTGHYNNFIRWSMNAFEHFIIIIGHRIDYTNTHLENL